MNKIDIYINCSARCVIILKQKICSKLLLPNNKSSAIVKIRRNEQAFDFFGEAYFYTLIYPKLVNIA